MSDSLDNPEQRFPTPRQVGMIASCAWCLQQADAGGGSRRLGFAHWRHFYWPRC
jgi:hypothetical protein